MEQEHRNGEEELAKLRAEVKKAQTEGVMTDSKQKEFDKLQQENGRIVKDIEGFRAEIDTLKKSVKGKEDELKQTRQLLD